VGGPVCGSRRRRDEGSFRGKLVATLDWVLDHPAAEVEAKLKELEEAGEPIPDDLYPPETLPGLSEWLAAFWELTTERPLGYGAVGPIPSSAIDRWVAKARMDEAEEELFRHCIRLLDRAYMVRVNKSGDEKPPEKPPVKPIAIPDNEYIAERPLTPALFDSMFGSKPQHKVGEVVSDEPITTPPKPPKSPRPRKRKR